MTGLEWPSPAMGVFQTMFVFPVTFQVVASGAPSETPLAAIPRNCGQSIPGRGVLAASGWAMVSAAASSPWMSVRISPPEAW